jgi:hypothetical protein
MAKARKRVAKSAAARRKTKTRAKTRKASTRKSKARKPTAKRPARKRRPKGGIIDKVSSGVQVLTDSFQESFKMQRKLGTRAGTGEG